MEQIDRKSVKILKELNYAKQQVYAIVSIYRMPQSPWNTYLKICKCSFKSTNRLQQFLK